MRTSEEYDDDGDDWAHYREFSSYRKLVNLVNQMHGHRAYVWRDSGSALNVQIDTGAAIGPQEIELANLLTTTMLNVIDTVVDILVELRRLKATASVASARAKLRHQEALDDEDLMRWVLRYKATPQLPLSCLNGCGRLNWCARW